MHNKKVILIALFGSLIAVFWQELNQYYLTYSFPSQNGLITCADESSYIRPADNFLSKNVWKDNSTGITSYFLRPPGFGMYYLLLKIIFGSKVWLAMKVVQIIFYFFSIILISKILNLFKLKEKQNLIFTSIYAFTPCFSGFMYFTITESITPFFVILSTYYFLKLVHSPKENALKFTFTSSFLILIRPQLIIFVLLFSFYIILLKRKKQALIMILAFLPFILWNIRTYTIANKWMGIHPIYSSTNNSMYRPTHEKMTNLFRIWEHDGAKFHTTIAILAGDTDSTYLEKALTNVPKKYHKKVIQIFTKFHELKRFQKQKLAHLKILKGEFKGEIEFYSQVDKTIIQLKSEHKFDYYFNTPFQSFKKLMISSHLNLYIFQSSFRDKILMEVLRYTCVLFLIAIYLTNFLTLFSKKINVSQLISFGIIISLFYLSFVQRLNEERYLTPVMPLAFIVFATFVNSNLYRRIFKKKELR